MVFNNAINVYILIIIHSGAADKKIDYVQYIKDAYEKAIKNAPIRKADIKR